MSNITLTEDVASVPEAEQTIPTKESDGPQDLPDMTQLPSPTKDPETQSSPIQDASPVVSSPSTSKDPVPVTIEDVPEEDPRSEASAEEQQTDGSVSPATTSLTSPQVLTPVSVKEEPQNSSPPALSQAEQEELAQSISLDNTPVTPTPAASKPRDSAQARQAPNVGKTTSPTQPTAMHYLDADSPPVTKEAIRLSTSPRLRREHLHDPSTYAYRVPARSHMDTASRAATVGEPPGRWHPGGMSDDSHLSTISERTEPPLPPPPQPPAFGRAYTVPDVRGPPQPPPLPFLDTSPTGSHFHPIPSPSVFSHPEPVPLSGYQLVSSKLTGQIGGLPVKSMYRRFSALNHRLLLYHQDELAELEEQLQHLDSADTAARMYPGGIVPASRRQETAHQNELYWAKEDLLTRIGHKLWLYNKVLASFRDTLELPVPSVHDIQDYQMFLANGNHIAEDERDFLNATHDLVTLDPAALRGQDTYSEDANTPMPRSAAEPQWPIQISGGGKASDGGEIQKTGHRDVTTLPPSALAQVALAMFAAILVPIFTFTVIPDFAGRITVIVLVMASAMTILSQSGVFRLLQEERGTLTLVFCTIAYGGVMAATAAFFK